MSQTLSWDIISQFLLFLFLENIVIVNLVQILNLNTGLSLSDCDIVCLSISPDEVGPGVAGVMDHHLLLSQAAVTATAEEGVIVQNDDIQYYSNGKYGPSHDKNGDIVMAYLAAIDGKPINPNRVG